MIKYIEVIKTNIQISFMYKWNVIITSVIDVFRLVAEIVFWQIIFYSNNMMYGYRLKELVTYYFFMYLVGAITSMGSIGHKVAEDIKNGNINNIILKPISCKKYYFCEILGARVSQLLFSIIIFIPVTIVIRHYLIFHISIGRIIYFLLAVAMATILIYLINLVISFLVFWFTEVTSFFFVKDILLDFLSGKTFPIDILPAGVLGVFNILPFAYCTFFPIKVLISDMNDQKIIFGIRMQVVWILCLTILAKLLWKKGLKHYTGTGM